MIRTQSKKVILVAPELFPDQLIHGYQNVRHVRVAGNLFPAIFEFNPEILIFDHDFVGAKDMEKILRRIRANKFYHKIRIHCFKNERSEKVDGLLKVLGVDHFIYREELLKDKKPNSVLNTVNSIIDNSIVGLTASVSN